MRCGLIWRTVVPRRAIRSLTAFSAPFPSAIMAITAATPITMPSIVRSERSLLARNAANATRTTSPPVPNTMPPFLFPILVEVKLEARAGFGNPMTLSLRRGHPGGKHVHEQARGAGVNRRQLRVDRESGVHEHPPTNTRGENRCRGARFQVADRDDGSVTSVDPDRNVPRPFARPVTEILRGDRVRPGQQR